VLENQSWIVLAVRRKEWWEGGCVSTPKSRVQELHGGLGLAVEMSLLALAEFLGVLGQTELRWRVTNRWGVGGSGWGHPTFLKAGLHDVYGVQAGLELWILLLQPVEYRHASPHWLISTLWEAWMRKKEYC
jgi:hypothetical protein